MKLLKKQNWYIWLLLLIIIPGIDTLIMGSILDNYDDDAWYSKWYYWTIGAAFLFIPIVIMACAFLIQITISNAKKLKVPGEEIYASPYSWILCLIVPVVGWILFFVMYYYIRIDMIVQLKKGNGEVYSK